jgi:transketolase
MRNILMEELTIAAERGDPVMLITGDLGWGVVEEFAKRFPKNFINAGVAEQNMMGMAAGLASEGYHVFVYSIGNFSTFRCAEQIRNDVDYHNVPVTVVAVGGGLAYGNLGYSHHAVQDFALMRSMPNMLIASPCDDVEARACIQYLLENPQPSYLRLGRGGEKQIHKKPRKMVPGMWYPFEVVEGDEDGVAHVFTGTPPVRLTEPGEYYTCPLWGMKYKDKQSYMAADFEHIITYEDHLEDGGFGSWMLESLHKWDISVSVKALNSKICGMVGDREYLLKQGEL